MIRFRKKYIKKLNRDISILKIESDLLKQYGLRNKKELYKTKGLVQKYQKLNRSVDHSTLKYKSICEKLIKLGIFSSAFSSQKFHTLSVNNFLERRLQTIVAKMKAISLSNARQLIIHGKVMVNKTIKRFPCYLIRVDSQISFK